MHTDDKGRTAERSGFTHAPGTVLGYRANGAPIYPIAGGDRTAPAPGLPAGVEPNAPAGAEGQRSAGTDATTGAPTLTHSGCINRLRDIQSQMSQVAELDTPTQADHEYFEELRAEFESVDAHRLRLERDAVLARVRNVAGSLSASAHLRTERGATYGGGIPGPAARGNDMDADPILEPNSVEERRFRNPWAYDEVRTYNRDPEAIATEWRSRAVSACERMTGATKAVREAATTIIERWDDQDASLSRLALALSDPRYLRAWSKLARGEGASADLEADERAAIAHVRHIARATRALSLTDTAGGYLVPLQLDPTVILTANGSVNEIRQAARQVVATGDVWNGVSAGAVAWSYDAEAAEVSDDSPTFASPAIPIYKGTGFVPISLEAIQDAANITGEVGRLLAEGKDILEASAFTIGSGVGMPTGIVTALSGSPGSIVAAGTDGTFAKGDVYNTQDSLPARYRRNSSWLGNNSIYSRIRQMGEDMFGPWGALSGDRPVALLGRRVLEAEDMDATPATTGANYVLIHGDFQNYVVADRIGMTVEFVPHLFGAAGRPTNQRGWLAYIRHGADSVNDAAFRMLNV